MNRRRKPMAEKISLATLEAAIIAYYHSEAQSGRKNK